MERLPRRQPAKGGLEVVGHGRGRDRLDGDLAIVSSGHVSNPDPTGTWPLSGPEALATEIERQLKLYPGMSIVSSAADVLGDRAWFRWSATLGTGESFNGVDFVEFAPDGRIARLTGFYEP